MRIGYWVGDLIERDHLEDLGVDGRITLKWIFRNWMEGCRMDLSGLGQEQVAGCCEGGDEFSASVKCREFRD